MVPWQGQVAGRAPEQRVAGWTRAEERRATMTRRVSYMYRWLLPRGVLLRAKAAATNMGFEQPVLANSEEAMPRPVTGKIPRPLPPPGCEASVAVQCWGKEVPMLSVELSAPALVGSSLSLSRSLALSLSTVVGLAPHLPPRATRSQRPPK